MPTPDEERVEILATMNELSVAAVVMRNQIRQAQQTAFETGKYADRDWYRRVESALHIKARQRQDCQVRLGELNRIIRMQRAATENADSGRIFIQVCKNLLPEKTYETIWFEVRRIQMEGETNKNGHASDCA